MKKIFTTLGIASFVLSATIALAATQGVYNGGFGQVAGKNDAFGVAICNGDAKDLGQAVPVSVTVGTQTVNVSSAPSIKAGGCEYTYVSYAELGMQAGGTYSVLVNVGTDHATYSVPVPQTSGTAGASQGTANVSTQSGNFFTMIVNWFLNLFK